MTEMTFEQSLQRLEEIVRILERNDLDLEQALKLFEEGIAHLRTAGVSLQAVDARVQQLVEAADGSFSVVELGA
jgi:exodeoxyribonuclease VII small subunit